MEGEGSPGFTGSLLGMMSSLFNVYGKNYGPGEKQWSGTAISAVALSAAFMVYVQTPNYPSFISRSKGIRLVLTYIADFMVSLRGTAIVRLI